MKNFKRQIAIGAILSYLNIGIGAIVTLFYTPFMIRYLGNSEYGLYNTVASVVSSLSILSLGFGSSYIRFFSKYKAEKREKDISKLNGMFLVVFFIIGVIACICGLFLTTNLQLVFKNGLSNNEIDTAKLLMMILTFDLALSFPASVFTTIITANEQFVFQKMMIMLKQVAGPMVTIPLLLMGYGSVGMVLSTVSITLIIDGLNIFYCKTKLNTYFSFQGFDIKVLKELALFSGFIAINMIVDQINLNLDKILLGRYRGTTAVAIYSAGYTLYAYYHSFSTSVSNVFTPRIHSIWNNVKESDYDKNIKLSQLFASVGQIQFIILWLVATGLLVFGRTFILWWVGSDYGESYYVVIILAISAIVPLSQNLGIEIQRAKNKHQFRAIVYLGMAIINLVLSIYLCQIWGPTGSAIGTAISFVVANTIIMNWFYQRYLSISIGLYWRKCLRIVAATLPVVIGGMIFYRNKPTNSIVVFLIDIAIYTICYGICLFLIGIDHTTREKLVKKGLNAIKFGKHVP